MNRLIPSLLLVVLGHWNQDGRGLDARPAGVPLPTMPNMERAEPHVSPPAAELARDGVLSERFTADGQRASYAFDAKQGELSLFELSAMGFARGWKCAVNLRVVDAQGRVLATTDASGGVELHALLAFEAPSDGRYALELVPTEAYFRFHLVRHSSYVTPESLQDGEPGVDPGADIGTRERVHTWVDANRAGPRLRLPVRAGEDLVVRVEPTREEARKDRSSQREREFQLASAGSDMMGSAGMTSRGMEMMGGRGSRSMYGGATLQLGPAAGLRQQGSTLVRLDPDRDGWLELTLVAENELPALVDLVIERAPKAVEVAGVAIDAQDEGLADVALEFIREPELDVWYSTRTDAAGAFEARLPVGNWRVRMQRKDSPPTLLRLGVSGPTRELVLLLPGGG